MTVPVLLLLATAGCGVSKSIAAKSAPEPERTAASLFTVPQAQLGHLKITPVRKTTWLFTVHTSGTVDWDADHTTQAITQVSGPIARILVDTGTFVKEGDPLLYVSSPDITGAISTYKKARNRLDLARRTLDRSRDLLTHGALAQKDFEGAQADYNDAFTEVETDLQSLKILGVTQPEIDAADRQGTSISPQLAVRSPVSGLVVQKLISPGQLIQAGATTCFMISDVSTVWTQGHIYEKDLASIRTGDMVEQTNPSYPEKFRGVISYIGAMIDPATRTTPVRIVTRNPGGLLKKDMIVDAIVHTKTAHAVLTVPTSAVLQTAENQPFVYVEVEPGKFAQRLVTVGAQQDDETEIVSGCKEGEQVVSEGSVFLQFANSYQ